MGFEITVSYNGVNKEIRVQPEEQMEAVLQHAIQAFSLQSAPHTVGLFTEANVQVGGRVTSTGVDIHQSVEEAGLTAGQIIFLRQVVQSGGAQ